MGEMLSNRFAQVADIMYHWETLVFERHTRAIQHALDCMTVEVARYGIFFASLKTLLQDWQVRVPALTLCSDQLEIINIFKHLRSLVASDGCFGKTITIRIA